MFVGDFLWLLPLDGATWLMFAALCCLVAATIPQRSSFLYAIPDALVESMPGYPMTPGLRGVLECGYPPA